MGASAHGQKEGGNDHDLSASSGVKPHEFLDARRRLSIIPRHFGGMGSSDLGSTPLPRSVRFPPFPMHQSNAPFAPYRSGCGRD